ncbi:hypothetical protein [Streptomyces noursei]
MKSLRRPVRLGLSALALVVALLIPTATPARAAAGALDVGAAALGV